MAESQSGFSSEALVSLLIAFVSLLAGMLVENPSLASLFLEFAAFATAIVIVRQTRWSILLRILLILGVAVISSVGTYEVFMQKREKDLHARFGRLVSGNHPLRDWPCKSDKGEALITAYVGPIAETSFKYPSVILKIDSQDDLVVDKNDEGKIVIKKLRLRDTGGKVIVRIDDNDFDITGGHYFRHPDGDLSVLEIVDDDDAVMFRLSFLNDQQIAIVGNFRSKDESKILISETLVDMYARGSGIRLSELAISHGCIRGAAFSTDGGRIAIGGPTAEEMSFVINPRD